MLIRVLNSLSISMNSTKCDSYFSLFDWWGTSAASGYFYYPLLQDNVTQTPMQFLRDVIRNGIADPDVIGQQMYGGGAINLDAVLGGGGWGYVASYDMGRYSMILDEMQTLGN